MAYPGGGSGPVVLISFLSDHGQPKLTICTYIQGISFLKRKDRIEKPAQIVSNRHKDTKHSKSKIVLVKFFTVSLKFAIFWLLIPYKPYKPLRLYA